MLAFTDLCFGGVKTGSELPWKWLQSMLVGQESKDIGLVVVWEIFHYLSSGLHDQWNRLDLELTIIVYDKIRVCMYVYIWGLKFKSSCWKLFFFLLSWNDFVGWWWCWWYLCRNFGLETKSLLICMTRDLVILVILISSLQGPTIVVMVNNILPQLENTLLNSSGTFLNKLS